MDEELMARAAMHLARTTTGAAGARWGKFRHRMASDFDPPQDLISARHWWEDRLRELLERDPDAGEEVRRLVDGVPPAAVAGRATAAHNTVSGSAHGPVVQAGAIGAVTFQTPGFSGTVPDPQSWPTAGDVDSIAFGVRPTHRVPGHPPLPPYVLRDCDHDLDAALGQARERGGLVLLLGEPFTGKTRTALAAMARGPAGRRVFAPAGGTDLRGLPTLLSARPERYVIWLDDLDEHLGDGGLEPRLLAQLVALRAVVVATMREDSYDACRARPGGRVLDVAHLVELAREWSPAERERVAQEAARTGDPRLIGVVSASGPEGAAAFLALGPLLRDEWWRARRADRHPRGHALVRAARDLARCGLTGPLPMDLLRKVQEGYADVTGMERESVDDALAWATEPRHGLLPLLARGTGDTWLAAPFHVEMVSPVLELPDVPSAVWGCALEMARADSAYDYAEIAAKARIAFQRAADAGDTSALHDLGLLAASLGEGEQAERWFRRAVEAGEPRSAGRLGRMLTERGDGKAAEPFLEAAAEAGDSEAAVLLGKLLRERARHWLAVGEHCGNAEAAYLRGDLLFGSGDTAGAYRSYQKAIEASYEPVAASYGVLLLHWGACPEAELWLRRAEDRGDKRAIEPLDQFDSPHAHQDDLVKDLQDGVKNGEQLTAANLGRFLELRDRPDEARPWYLKGYEQGDAYGAFRLAELHKKDGDEAEARSWYRKAAAMGHPGAKRALGESDA
ncbi:tetratricopeptide repeat protein [Streptomyces noursei]|uniref:tetratricopeptide repeat protein n=1 Tax=Streptomyces noursei TaxID=1971 RepID=UPI00344B7F90